MDHGTTISKALLLGVLFGATAVVNVAAGERAALAGTTITVTTTADDNSVDGNCSFREALQAANGDHMVDACPAGSGTDAIVLGAHTYDVHIGWLNVASNVVIRGVAAASTFVDDSGTMCSTCGRTLLVSAGAHLTLSDVTIAHAATAIRNQGTLDLNDSSIANEDAGCAGPTRDQAGAIHNQGIAVLHDVTVTHVPYTIFNALHGTFDADGLTMSRNEPCDEGRSIYNAGNMVLVHSTFDADIGALAAADSIFNFSTGTLTITYSRFRHNVGLTGTAVIVNIGTAVIGNSAFDRNSVLPIRNEGRLALIRSRISTNHPTFDLVGALDNSGTLDLRDSTVDHNFAAVGGIYNGRGYHATGYGNATLTDDTISDNVAAPSVFSSGGPLPGGGITNDTVMLVRDTTIVRNRVTRYRDWRYHAGGIVTTPGGFTALSSSIVANNIVDAPVRAPDCFGRFRSLGYNLVQHVDYCNFDAATTGDVHGVSAALRPFAANGGPTMTFMPSWGSPAIDAGSPTTPDDQNATTCTELDQRGVVRPRDGDLSGSARCDIGAVER